MECSSDRMLRSIVTVGQGSAGALQQSDALREIAGEIIPAQDSASAVDLIRQRCPELVLISQDVCVSETVQFIQSLQALSPDVPVVVLSENPSVDDAVRFVRAGALDYIAGPLDEGILRRLVDGMRMDKASHDREHRRLFCDKCPPGVEIVGRSPGIVECLETIRLVSESRCNPVLILGETGVGKELAARAVHWWRYGDFERFVAVNCAALTAGLLESELFGHAKGAFTGADREKKGLFEQASGGSIFLDEISEMAPELQTKLLRVLQERTFRRVGGAGDIPCNATVIVSSNRNLLEAVKEGKFRRDLYYRVAVFPIIVPPLAREDRRSDIPILAEYFLRSFHGPGRSVPLRLGEQAEQRLMRHNWPGNVRELRNVIERAIILERGEEVSVSSLVFDEHPEQLRPVEAPPAEPEERPLKDFSLEAAEREFIVRALRETGWKRTQAAALLGITRSTLHAKLKRYDIKAPGGRRTPVCAGDGPEDGHGARNCPDAADAAVSEKQTSVA